MMIEGYEISKYIDPITARIIKFLHKARTLYICDEDNNKNILKYSYLNLCTYNYENDVKDYYKLLKVSLADFNMRRETSNWTIEYNRYPESIRRKCNWCDIKPEFCPIKIYADMKNYAIHNKLDLNKLVEKLVDEPILRNNSNDVIEKNIANRIVRICREFATLRLAQVLIETKTIEIIEVDFNNNVQYKYIDLNVKSNSLINNLYNYYSNSGYEKYSTINIINLEGDSNENHQYEVHEIAAYILYLCKREKVDITNVFNYIYLKCGNIAESKFNTYYQWYYTEIDNLDINNDAKDQIKEIITYIRNFHIEYKYHLPYVQINFILQIDDEILLDTISNIVYKLALTSDYIKEKFSIIDAEFLYTKYDKDIDIISNIEKVYKESGMIIIKNLDKVLLSENKKESFFKFIEGYIKEYNRSITIFVTKNDLLEDIKGNPYILKSIRHNINVQDYDTQKIQKKTIERLRKNYNIEETTIKKIEDIIKNEYTDSIYKNNDYINWLYENIIYNNYNFLNKSDIIDENKVKTDLYKTSNRKGKKLEDLIGLEDIKREVQKFKNLLIFNKKIENRIEKKDMNMNMLFLGNPGTGKTTVASIMADILYELGYIKKNKFTDVSAKDLIAEYIGQTAIKTSRVIENALDGVLFIDEAYSIISQGRAASFGEESLAVLVQAMEKYKNRLIVIFAGYTSEMKTFVNANPGIASRIGYTFEFNNYTTEELIEILKNYANNKSFIIQEEAIPEISNIIENNKNSKNFGNARFVINLFEKLIMIHAQDLNENDLTTISKKDVINLQNEKYISKKSLEQSYTQLNKLVGLANVKEEIEGLADLVILNNKIEKRIPLNLNMIFIGNPGTGKTTVARIFAEILFDLGYIKNNKLIEVTGKDLIGEYIGQTAPKTEKVLEDALDGLLFIDEAYTLMNQTGESSNFSLDAISTITKFMTDYEDRITIIFAGYKQEMKNFMEINSGLVSRIGETIEFEDYSEEELLQIYLNEMAKSEFEIDEEFINGITKIINENKKTKNFGNARFVINLYKKTLMQHAKRCRNIDNTEEIRKITIQDLPIIKIKKEKRIGF